MKQRILSFFLVVCMLVAVVPVFLLPAAATGETIYEFRSADGDGRMDTNTYGTLLTTVTGDAALAALDLNAVPGAPEDLLGWYAWHNAEFVSAAAFVAGIAKADGTVIFYPVTKTSSFSLSQNMPLTDKTAGTFGGFRGGWVVGRYDTAFTRYENNNAGILTVTTNNWGDGGIYLGAGGNPTGSMILPNFSQSPSASTVRYQAVAAGEATLTVPKVTTSNGSAAIMAVMHNGVYLWPEALKGQSFTTVAADKTLFADTPTADLTLDITLAFGDTVDVLVKRKDGAAVGTAHVNPVVTYTGDVQASEFCTTFEQKPGGANFPVIDTTANTMEAQTGTWQVGRYKSGTFAAFDDASANALMKVTGESEWGNGGMYFNVSSGGAGVPYMAILPSGANCTSAVRYTSPVAATLNITMDVSFVNANAAYAILHNNEIIWPRSGTFTSDYVEGDWELTTAAKAAVPTVTLPGITVAAGDTIAFVADRGSAGSGQGFYGLKMQISGRMLAAGSLSENCLPDTAGENGSTVTYPGAWSLVNYEKADAITADNARLMNVCSGTEFWVDNTGKPGDAGTYGALAYRRTGAYWGGKVGAIAVKGGAAAGWRYTAEVSGFAKIDFAEFGNYIKDNDGSAIDSNKIPKTEYAVYLNGQKVWPADGWYSIADMEANQNYAAEVNAAVAAACPNGIYLTTGDHLEVLCKTPSGTAVYDGRGQRFAPRVIVEEKTADATLEYSARLNDAFALNFGLTAADARSVRLVYTLDGGDAQTVTCTKDGALFSATADGVTAAHMTAPLTYTLWGEVDADNGAVPHRLAAGETTFAAVMMQYVEAYRDATDAKGKAIYNLAVATLNYGAAAQERFNAENTVLPNADLTEAEKAYTLTGETADATLTTNADAIYTFAGASLLLEDTVKLKVFVNAQDGKTAPDGDVYLEYATSADFADAKTVKLVQRGNEGDAKSNASLKAALTILPDAYAETYYMRVVQVDESGNATVIGTVLTYSVAAYAARVPGEKTLTDCIITMGEAAEAYLAALA